MSRFEYNPDSEINWQKFAHKDGEWGVKADFKFQEHLRKLHKRHFIESCWYPSGWWQYIKEKNESTESQTN